MPARTVNLPTAVEFFPALEKLAFVRHGFVGRLPGIDVATDRSEALARLDVAHRAVREQLGLRDYCFATGEQVHSDKVAVIDSPPAEDHCIDGVDGLITNQPSVSLGIYVADCAAVFLVDPVQRCIGLLHSGKKGTELAIVAKAIERMQKHFNTDPSNLIVQLSPCIRPPNYEVDFAAKIVQQARAAGVAQIYDSGRSTAADLQSYYSYRAEKGRTGRMLALLALVSD